VYFGKNRKTGRPVAIKKVPVNDYTRRREAALEISFLTFVSHQNVVGFEDAFLADNDAWVRFNF
jgi:serine/threonine protein kinase